MILETVDAIRKILASIQQTGKEGTEPFTGLKARLRDAAQTANETQAPAQEKPAEVAAKTVRRSMPTSGSGSDCSTS